MKQKTLTKKKPLDFKNTSFVNGDYTGVDDKNGRPILVGQTVKITIGKANNGYLVIFEAGAFCFTGGAVGTCSFIKFRDELICGMITGKPDYTNFESFLLIVDAKPDPINTAPITNHRPTGSGGAR